MKKLIAMLLALTMVLSMGAMAFAAEGEEAAEDEEAAEAEVPELPDYLKELELPEVTTIEEGKLIMSTNAQFPPYEMVADADSTGFAGTGFEGIDVEIAWYLAQTLGLELQINDIDFDAAMLDVQNNSSDMMLAGLSYSEERDENMDMSDTYAHGVQVVIIPEDSDIETAEDLADGKLIGVQRGTTGDMYCTDEYGEENVQSYDNGAIAVQALMNGQLDAVVIDQEPAEQYVAANEGLKTIPSIFEPEEYVLAVDEGNTQLLDVLNTILNTMIENGLVSEIMSHYIGGEAEPDAEPAA